MSRPSAKSRKATTSSAWFDLDRACMSTGVHRLLDKALRESIREEKGHRSMGVAFGARRYRLPVRTCAQAIILRHVANGAPDKPASWREAVDIRTDVALAYAIAEAIGPDWTDHGDAIRSFDYADEAPAD